MSKRFTAEELEKLREIAEAANTVEQLPLEERQLPENVWRCVTYGREFTPPTVLAMLDEIERLRREREVLVEALMPASEALADLDKGYYRVAKQDPGGYVMGSVSVVSLVTAIEATRKALAILDGEKGGGGDVMTIPIRIR